MFRKNHYECYSKNWDTVATSVNAQDGLYSWPIPSNTEKYDFRMKICYNGGSEYSISQGYFQIEIDEPVISNVPEINRTDGIYLYPLPARTSLNILSNDRVIKQISVYDFTMKQVLENSYHDITNTAIDIAGLADGFYYMILTYTDNTKSIKNFVKF